MMESVREWFQREGLVRPKDGRVLGGVVAGLGRRLGIEPWPARLLFVVALLILPGSQVLVYPVLWVLMPEESTTSAAVDRSTGTVGVTTDLQSSIAPTSRS